jgi:hypothetical protein
MKEKPILLSASVPERDLNIYTTDTSAKTAIREAVRALVDVVVPVHPLVFGGHHAISPMVWEDANSLGLADRVFIYQSRFFTQVVPKEALFFQGLNRLVWTPKMPRRSPDKDRSLALMRDAMVVRRLVDEKKFLESSAKPDFPEYAAAVFIGGMNGVEVEWELFRQRYPKAPALLIASTKGAALRLMADQKNLKLYDTRARQLLERDKRYGYVFRELLRT